MTRWPVRDLADAPFADVINDVEVLRDLIGHPHELMARKKIDHVDDGAAAVLAASPFVLMATADHLGRCTVSPKGGRPGFVNVLDAHRLAIPDYVGNNLIDGMRNLLANPHIGLLFVLSGRNMTLRVEGSVWLTTDGSVLNCLDPDADFENRRPFMAIGVAVESTFVHCEPPATRWQVWEPATCVSPTPTGSEQGGRFSESSR